MSSPYSLYDATVGMTQGALRTLDGIFTKGESHPDALTFLETRLIEDMKPLTFQASFAVYLARLVAAELSGKKLETPREELDTFEKIHAGIKVALDELALLDRDAVNKIGETNEHLEIWGHSLDLPVKTVVNVRHMTNIYFHVAMAYAILRMKGVDIGKKDWIAPFAGDFIKF